MSYGYKTEKPKATRGAQEPLWFFIAIAVIFFLSFVSVFLFIP